MANELIRDSYGIRCDKGLEFKAGISLVLNGDKRVKIKEHLWQRVAAMSVRVKH